MTRPSLADYGTHDESAFTHLWNGVVGAWCPLLGPTGLRLHDFSRRVNWGTLTNMDAATDWVVNGGQYALDFDGVNDQVVISPTRVSGSVSISLWLLPRTNTFGQRVFCDRQDGAGGVDIYIGTSNNIGIFLPSSGAEITTPANSLAANVWNHLIVSCGPGRGQIFLNGQLSVSSTGNFTVGLSGSNLFLGRYAPVAQAGLFFDGLLDDVFVATGLLSANVARDLYQIGRGGIYQRRRRTKLASVRRFQAGWARGSNVILQPCGVS